MRILWVGPMRLWPAQRILGIKISSKNWKITKMNVNELRFDKLSQLGSGSECTVYDLGDGTCYKLYAEFYDIETIYCNAEIAYEFGIGPEVYECGKDGYRTEIVETLDSICKCSDYQGVCKICDDCDIFPRV